MKLVDILLRRSGFKSGGYTSAPSDEHEIFGLVSGPHCVPLGIKEESPSVSTTKGQATSSASNEYRKLSNQAKAIINRHMTEAFNDIREALGETPISVSLNIQPLQTMGDTHATGVYAGCDISFSE